VVSVTFRPLYTRGSAPVQVLEEPVWAPEPVWAFFEEERGPLRLLGFEPRVGQTVARWLLTAIQ
jgi:hypothetical protein